MTAVAQRVAAVTGAASGIGRALALELAGRGSSLALADLDGTLLAEVAMQIRGRHDSRVTTTVLDVADHAAVQAWAGHVGGHFGGCDLLFNNAGVGHGTLLAEVDMADFTRLMDVNFWGVVHGTRAFLPLLTASGAGHVVNTGSLMSCLATPGQGSYVASKFAVRGYTEALAQELMALGAPVRASCVMPAGVATHIAQNTPIDDCLVRFAGLSREQIRQAFREIQAAVPADAAARRILRGVEQNAARILVGAEAHGLDLMQRMFPERHLKWVAHGFVPRLRRMVARVGRRAQR